MADTTPKNTDNTPADANTNGNASAEKQTASHTTAGNASAENQTASHTTATSKESNTRSGDDTSSSKRKKKDDEIKPGDSAKTKIKKKMKNPWVKRGIIAGIVLAVAVIAYLIYNFTRDKGYGPGFASGNGRLEATEIDVSTKLAGRISEIRVDEGDFVQAGEILAVMQLDVLEAQLGEAKAQVLKAQADEASAEAQIAVWQSDVTAAQATVAQRQSELEQTRRRLNRSTVLSERGVITGQQYDDDETTEMAAQAAVETARAQVSVAQAAVQAAQADAQGAAAAVRAAQASVDSVLADIKDSYLPAPRNGRVQYRIVQPGEVLAAGGRVLNFVDLADVYMNFFLPAEQAGRVAIGGETRILLDAFPDRPLSARITYVAETAQFTPKTVETETERQNSCSASRPRWIATSFATTRNWSSPACPA
ncbi:MAG: efflux RND transporter periplasmic adaptor subunit [Planctomycetaceae bacterium]|nr:efflux RND transporter periplasmic adaptor subunit [Planctomycetaceae bacterium]